MFLGDFALGETLYCKFTTRRFSTGAPHTLAGTPVVSAYEDDSTTQITAGITLTVDFDSVTGLNHLTVVATSGNGFEAGKQYDLVITAGTVDSVSVVGEVVARFSIECGAALRPTTAGRTLTIEADGMAHADVKEVAGTTQTAGDIIGDTNDIQARLPPALVGGRIDANVGAISSDATAADNAEAFFDGTGYAGTGNTIPTVTTLTNDPTGVTTLLSRVGTPTDFGSGTSTIAANLQDLADDGTATFDRSTDSLQAIRDRGDAAWTEVSAAEIRSAVGLASANLDTQLDALPTAAENADAVWDEDATAHQTQGTFGQAIGDPGADSDTLFGLVNTNLDATVSSRASQTSVNTIDDLVDDLESRIGTPSNLGGGATVAANLADIEAQTDDIGVAGAGLTAVPWNASWDAEVESEALDALNTILADSIPADGTLPTARQALYMITQFLLERAVSGSTVTVKKADGTTSLFTLTLNDATTPTSITRAT